MGAIILSSGANAAIQCHGPVASVHTQMVGAVVIVVDDKESLRVWYKYDREAFANPSTTPGAAGYKFDPTSSVQGSASSGWHFQTSLGGRIFDWQLTAPARGDQAQSIASVRAESTDGARGIAGKLACK